MNAYINQIKEKLDTQRDYLKKTYFVENLGVFGSVARGDNTEKSDIDLLITFSQPVGMFTFIEVEDYLSKLLNRKVDLVTKKALKPAIKNEILQQVIYV